METPTPGPTKSPRVWGRPTHTTGTPHTEGKDVEIETGYVDPCPGSFPRQLSLPGLFRTSAGKVGLRGRTGDLWNEG